MIDKYHYNLLKLSVLLVVVHDGVEVMGNSDNSASRNSLLMVF